MIVIVIVIVILIIILIIIIIGILHNRQEVVYTFCHESRCWRDLHHPVHVIPANAGIQRVAQTRGFRVMPAKKMAAMRGMTKV